MIVLLKFIALIVVAAQNVLAGPPACLTPCFNVTCGGVNGFIGSVPEPLTPANGSLWTDCMCIGYDLSSLGAAGFTADSGIGRCAGLECYGENFTAAQTWSDLNFCSTKSNPQSPFRWSIRSELPTNGTCAKAITTTYVATNFAEAVIHAIVGFQRTSKRNSNKWRISWILSTVSVLASNAVAAYMIKRTPGYGTDFAIWEYMLLLTTRPRLAWILGAFLSPSLRVKSIGDEGIEYHPWQAWFFPAFVSEVILMLFSSYFMGQTVNFGVKTGMYHNKSMTGVLPPSLKLLYGGALYWLVTAVILIPVGLITSLYVIGVESPDVTKFYGTRDGEISTRRRTQSNADENASRWLKRAPVAAKVTLFMIPTTWAATWMWNIGLFNLEGPVYCPPKLAETGVIWTAFSTLAVILPNLPFGRILGKSQTNIDLQRNVQSEGVRVVPRDESRTQEKNGAAFIERPVRSRTRGTDRMDDIYRSPSRSRSHRRSRARPAYNYRRHAAA